MTKIVTYNGGTERYHSCDDPIGLKVGKQYEIIKERDINGFQTNITLKEFPGKEFNSVWFNDVVPKAYLAISAMVPKVGEILHCSRLKYDSASGYVFDSIHTSTIQSVIPLPSSIYQVTTKNSIYFVEVHTNH